MSTPTRRLSEVVDEHEARILTLEKAFELFESKFEERVETAIVNAFKRLTQPKNLSKLLTTIAGFITSLYALIQFVQRTI